jgi:hypothetical protein
LKGPIPGEWLELAAELPGRALHVALAIRHQVDLTRCTKVKLTHHALAKFGTLPDAGARGLAALEHKGLVAVDRHNGRCPVVKIKEIEVSGGSARQDSSL